MKRYILALLAVSMTTIVPAQNKGRDGKQPQYPDDKPRTAYMVSDAHLDTQWNWDIQTTIREYIPKTIRQNLHLLDTYPEYIFNFEGAVKYAWMKEYYPEEYKRVKEYVKQGRWHLTGCSWDADETIIVSPESWLRNTMLGQTFFRDEYGKESTDIFLPDCFGFSYTLPTLAAHCGLIGFSSQKLGWRNNDFYEGKLKRYPFSVGLWQGIDGSRIMMAHGYGYGQTYPEQDLSENRRLLHEMNESTLPQGYRYYGTGDTGGSPTVETVRSVVKGMKGNGPVKILCATSDQLYKDYLPFDQHPELPVFDGELTMDVHGTGCYTSEAAMKSYNRQNEHLADAAERASVVAEWAGAMPYPGEWLTDAWHRMIVHQFHDDLTGTSIPRAYEFSWNDELIALSQFSSVLTSAVSGVASQMNTDVNGVPVVLYNPESYTQKALAEVTLPEMGGAYIVTAPNGKKVASQVVSDSQGNRHLLIDAQVAPTGFGVFGVKASGKEKPFAPKDVKKMENKVYRLQFDENGDISSLVDKRSGKEYVEKGQAIGLVIFDDCRSEAWPAWEVLKHTVDKAPVKITGDVSVQLIEDGALRSTVCVTKHYGESTFHQYVRLYKGTQAERIDFYNEVDWRSPNSLLKANFPLSFSNPHATYDLGLGSVERGNNQANSYEVYSHEWTDLTASDASCGLTVLNNCKYGWDKPSDNTIRLSLLFAPKPGGGYKYQAQQDMGWHQFTYSLVAHKGALSKSDAVWQSTMLNSPLRAFATTKHKGSLGRTISFAESNNPNIIVRALKKAEKGDEYIVRVYENSGKEVQKGSILFGAPIAKAEEADGTEKALGAASFEGSKLQVEIKPFSVKTYRIRFAGQPSVAEKAQAPLTLPYNKRCISPNGFRASADFEGGNSYAAELLPSDRTLRQAGVNFTLADPAGRNGFVSEGDTIALPEGTYDKVYLLAASSNNDAKALIGVLGTKDTEAEALLGQTEADIPYYSGFIGQWGHEGHTEGFFKEAEIAYVGSHRHASKEDEPYEYTYMFRIPVELPQGAKAIVLPSDQNITYFAATAVNEGPLAQPAGKLFCTHNKPLSEGQNARPANLLSGAKVVAVSGEANEREKASNLIDGDLDTKWCDTKSYPSYADFDLGESKEVKGWRIVNAGQEDHSYITRCVLLQGRNDAQGEWQTLDLLDSNQKNDVTRSFQPTKARFIRLYVIGAEQGSGQGDPRIYELELY